MCCINLNFWPQPTHSLGESPKKNWFFWMPSLRLGCLLGESSLWMFLENIMSNLWSRHKSEWWDHISLFYHLSASVGGSIYPTFIPPKPFSKKSIASQDDMFCGPFLYDHIKLLSLCWPCIKYHDQHTTKSIEIVLFFVDIRPKSENYILSHVAFDISFPIILLVRVFPNMDERISIS